MQRTSSDHARTVFVIEDDVLQINWIKLTIEHDGTQVVPVKIKREAIEQAVARSTSEDVFLIDIFLNHDLDGLAVTDIIADSKFPGSVIFVSGDGADYLPMAQRLAEARGLRVSAVIEKPLLPRKLRASINSTATKHRL